MAAGDRGRGGRVLLAPLGHPGGGDRRAPRALGGDRCPARVRPDRRHVRRRLRDLAARAPRRRRGRPLLPQRRPADRRERHGEGAGRPPDPRSRPPPRQGPFITLDCTTVVPTLAGSEFFGHERGAFTGAVAARDGAFALADGGTLFLDEVGELPPALQAELLRVVQEGAYKRVGGNRWQRTRFRLVSATHRDLAQEAAADRFRHDFLYRIAPWRCPLPPLRERPDDVLVLARHFLERLDGTAPPLDPAVDAPLPPPVPGQRPGAQALGGADGPPPCRSRPGDDRRPPRRGTPAFPERWDEGDFTAPIQRALGEGADSGRSATGHRCRGRRGAP